MRRWGRDEEAARLYEQASRQPTDDATSHAALIGLAGALTAIGQPLRAAEVCVRAIDRRPQEPEAHAMLALVRLGLGELEDAARCADAAWSLEPGSSEFLCLRAAIALRRQRFDEAWTAAAAALERDAMNARARSLRALAELGRGDRAVDLDARRLVRRDRVVAVAGYGSRAAFDSALIAAILADPGLEPARPGAVLEGGRRLHDVFSLDAEFAAPLRAMILEQARRYAREIAPPPIAGGATPEPVNLLLRGWANVMEAGHREAPHIHESAWLSVVYYPTALQRGWGGEVLFGPHDLGSRVPAPKTHELLPEQGSIVTFPSHLYHSTRPFAGPGQRISIAFDVSAARVR